MYSTRLKCIIWPAPSEPVLSACNISLSLKIAFHQDVVDVDNDNDDDGLFSVVYLFLVGWKENCQRNCRRRRQMSNSKWRRRLYIRWAIGRSEFYKLRGVIFWSLDMFKEIVDTSNGLMNNFGTMWTTRQLLDYIRTRTDRGGIQGKITVKTLNVLICVSWAKVEKINKDVPLASCTRL